MSNSSRTYHLRIGHYSVIDGICKLLQEEFKPYKGDKDYKKIKKQKFLLFSEDKDIPIRRLIYIYKLFESRGTTAILNE